MKKQIKALILCVVMSIASLLGACGIGEEKQEHDSSKTQLYVGWHEGGLGRVWLDEIAKNYMDTHESVEIVISQEKDNYNNNNLFNSIATSGIDIYLVNDIVLRDFVASGYVMDITDVMNDSSNGSSIASRISDETIRNGSIINGKYYSAPYYVASFGSVYDKDLFESKNLYFNETGTDFVTSKTAKRSAGLDGKFGTYDDGLPVTYSQYKKLLEHMRARNITPYTWSGKDVYYRRRLLTSFWADYEGKDNFNLNNTFNGTDSKLGEINTSNAVKLQEQSGKKYATEFAYDIMSDARNYQSTAFGPSQTHIMAQDEFLNSTTTAKPIAMIAEGGWWENEAKSTFNDLAVDNSSLAYGTRKFGLMPVPKADDNTSNARRTVTFGGTNSNIIINSKTTKKDLAIEFFKYLHSEESMRLFTKYSGCVRPYTYTLSKDDYNYLTPFQKECYDLYKSSDVDIVYIDAKSGNDFYLNNSAYFSGWDWKSQTSQTTYSDPLTAFYNSSKLTVDEYVGGLSKVYSNWPK